MTDEYGDYAADRGRKLAPGLVVPHVFGPGVRNAVPTRRSVLFVVPEYTTHGLLGSLIDGSADRATDMDLGCVTLALLVLSATGLKNVIGPPTGVDIATVRAPSVLALVKFGVVRRLIVDTKVQILS